MFFIRYVDIDTVFLKIVKKGFSGDSRGKELQVVFETWYASIRTHFCHSQKNPPS